MSIEFCIVLSFAVVILLGISINNSFKLSDIEKKMSWIADHITKIRTEINEHNCNMIPRLDNITEVLEEEEVCDCGCPGCELCEDSCDELDIHLISKEQWMFDHAVHHHYELKYYPNSDRVVYLYDSFCEDHEFDEFEIENVAEVIGDGLKFFGVRSGDENVVYVRNNRFKADFKITKVVS